MGRHRRTCPAGKLRLTYNKKTFKADKAYTLYFEYTWLNNPPIRKDTGIRVKVQDWNQTSQSLRPSYGTTYKRDNQFLQDSISKYDSMLRIYEEKHPNQISNEVIHAILFGAPLTRKDEGEDFIHFVEKTLQSKLTRGKIRKSRYENGLSCMKVFREFLYSQGKGTYKDDSIYLGDVSQDLIVDYITYRRNIKKNTDATINHALTPIISACEVAKNQDLIEQRVYAEIKDCRIVEKPRLDEEYDNKYLTKSQLQDLIDFYNEDTEPRRKEYIEMFLFAFHTGGLRMIDIMTLQWNHISIEKRELRKIQVKTASNRIPRHIVPLTDPAIAILNIWKERNRREKFVFDLVEDDLDINDEQSLYYKRNSCDKKVNQALQIVGKRIGLPFSLGFHVARHTFAINALNDHTSLSVVSRMLGHSSTDITEKVYAAYLPETLASEMERLDYNFLPDLKL